MKRFITTTLFIFLAMSMIEAQDIKLPAPKTNGGMPLMEALQKRVTSREFSDKMLSDQQLSDLLWAANGINRDNGKRTALKDLGFSYVTVDLQGYRTGSMNETLGQNALD